MRGMTWWVNRSNSIIIPTATPNWVTATTTHQNRPSSSCLNNTNTRNRKRLEKEGGGGVIRIIPRSSNNNNNNNNRVAMETNTNTSSLNDKRRGDAEEEEEEKKEVLVQYVVMRRDLIDTWPLGSVVTQACHASVSAIWSFKHHPHTLLYCHPDNLPSMHKVTLEVKGETQMMNLSEKLTASDISHKLWIEQPENIPTCLATRPYPKSVVSSFFRKLKLCK